MQLSEELQQATAEMKRCMGGVDPTGCVRAAQRINVLREALRNDTHMNEHLLRVVNTPESLSKKKRRKI